MILNSVVRCYIRDLKYFSHVGFKIIKDIIMKIVVDFKIANPKRITMTVS